MKLIIATMATLTIFVLSLPLASALPLADANAQSKRPPTINDDYASPLLGQHCSSSLGWGCGAGYYCAIFEPVHHNIRDLGVCAPMPCENCQFTHNPPDHY